MMRAFLRSSLFKTAGIYGGLNIIRQLIPFLLLPIMTRYLTPSDYGTLAMFNMLISFLYIFISLNLDGAIGREFYEKEDIDFPQYVANALGIGVLTSLLFVPIIYLYGPMLTPFTGVPHDLLWIVLAVGFCRYIIQILLIIWQSGMRAMSYSSLQIAQIIVEVALTVILVVFLKMGLQGRVDSVLYASGAFCIIAFAFLYREGWLRFQFNPTYIKMALSFGIPLIPHVIGGIAISMTDRALLINMTDATQTGLYFIGFQIGNVLNMAVWAFNQAWNPWLFERLKGDEASTKNMIVKFSYLYCCFLVLCALIISWMAPFIFRYFIGPDFAGGVEVVFWIAMGSAFLGMYYIVGCYITYTRKTHILSWITLVVGIVNLGASYILIKHNGYVGAAQGTMISYILSFVLTWILAAKVYPMPWFSCLRAKTS